jgi:hypothetical protein
MTSLPAGTRGTFVPDTGAPVRGVVLVAHPDGRMVLETLPADPPPVRRAAEVQPLLEAELQNRWGWPAEKATRLAAVVMQDLQEQGVLV